MSKKDREYYQEFSYRPDKKRRSSSVRRDRGIIFLVVLLSFAAVLIMVFLFSDILGLGIGAGGKANKLSFDQKKYYAVQLAAASSETEASAFAASIKADGGAGYVHFDGSYFILASAYANEADANAVIGNLTTGQYTPVKYVIDIPAKTLVYLGASTNVTRLQTAVLALLESYTKLYTASVGFDSGDMTKLYAKAEIIAAYNSLDSARAEFEVLTASETAINYARIKALYVNNLNVLDNLVNSSSSDTLFSSEIKYAYLEILFGWQALMKEL